MLDHHFPQTLNGDFGAYPPSCPILEERRSGLFPRPCCTESWAESQASDVAANEAVAACPSCSFLQLWMTLNYPPVIQHGKSWKSPKQIAGVLEVLFAEKNHRSEWRIFRSSQRASWALASTEVCSGSWITEGPEDTAESKMLCLRQTWENMLARCCCDYPIILFQEFANAKSLPPVSEWWWINTFQIVDHPKVPYSEPWTILFLQLCRPEQQQTEIYDIKTYHGNCLHVFHCFPIACKH